MAPKRTPKAEHCDPKPFVLVHVFPGGAEVIFRFCEFKRAERKLEAIGKSNCIEWPFKFVHKDGAVILRSI